MSIAQKNVQINGVFPKNINKNVPKDDLEASMDLENPQKSDINLHNVSQSSILTTIDSEESLNQNEPLNIFNQSNSINLNSSDNIEIFKSKEKDVIYSFSEEYFDEVYMNLLLEEKKYYKNININYMNFQKSINDKMRAILVDWLIDVHFKFDMRKKTLFNCIYIIDAFLSKNFLDKKYLQLLGMTALLISCKETEIMYPSLNSFLALSDYSYSLEELTNMERHVMKILDFDILAPTAEEFYAINAEYFKFTEKQRFFGEYFLDASLIDYNLLKYKQSTIAKACSYIVMKFFNLNGIHSLLKNTCDNIKQIDVKKCAKDLCFLVRNLPNSSLRAIKNKYLSDKFFNIAELCDDKK